MAASAQTYSWDHPHVPGDVVLLTLSFPTEKMGRASKLKCKRESVKWKLLRLRSACVEKLSRSFNSDVVSLRSSNEFQRYAAPHAERSGTGILKHSFFPLLSKLKIGYSATFSVPEGVAL